MAFRSQASNLVPGDTNNELDIFVRDRSLATTERVNVSNAGGQTIFGGPSLSAAISADGRFVAFASLAPNLVANDTNGSYDVFVRDRSSGVTERVNVTSSGVQAAGLSNSPSISDDGRYVAFSSTAANLVPGDTNGVAEIFVRDRLSGTTERISVDGPGVQGNGDSTVPVTNADGRFVAFESIATNLVSGDTNGLRDIFLHDRVTGTTPRASIAGDGSQALGGNSYQPDITAGGTVAFQSLANNLVAGDANDAMDVFVRTLSDTDSDGDDWSDQAEATIGTNPTSACGVDAWPADINNDGFSDGTDITIVAGSFGKAVPPAPTS